MLKQSFFILTGIVAFLVSGSVQADDQALTETARKTFTSFEKSVISINAIAKLQPKLGGVAMNEQEQKLDCLATIIDPSGLAMTSLTNVSPQNAMPKMRISKGGENQTLEIDCEVRGIKYRLSDGTEVPGRIVFKDEELDLAFLAPEKPLEESEKAKFSVVPVDGKDRKVELLDRIISLTRMGKNVNFTPAVSTTAISAIITKPRVNYFSSLGTLGTPVFDAEGNFLGLVVRYVSGDKEEVDAMSGMAKLQQSISSTILPASEIAKLIPQALEEAKKPVAAEKE